MKKYVANVIRLFSKMILIDNNLITFDYWGYSGSNLSPLIEEIGKGSLAKYKVKIIYNHKVYSDSKKSLSNKIGLYKHLILKCWYFIRSKLVVTTHGYYRLRSDNIMLNLWHGIPLKAMGLMNKSKNDPVGVLKDDYFLSTSEFYNTIMNACLGRWVHQYFIAGYPRNDYLFNQDGTANLERLLGRTLKENKKVILCMPTFRDKERQNGNIFGFYKFDFEAFSGFLEKNDMLCILKLHPNEEQLFLDTISEHTNDYIHLIRSDGLENYEMDFYKLINAVDLLITDYSSIYFDYLLLNRPIVFVPVDFEQYKKERGFLLEPYDFWAPGPKCYDQASLCQEIVKSLSDKTYYEEERELIKNIVHKYQTGNATARVIKLITEIMDK